jgi:hypothetical protein
MVNMEMYTEFLWGIYFKMPTWKTEKELENNIKTFFLRSVWDKTRSLGASASDCLLYQPRTEDERNGALVE